MAAAEKIWKSSLALPSLSNFIVKCLQIQLDGKYLIYCFTNTLIYGLSLWQIHRPVGLRLDALCLII